MSDGLRYHNVDAAGVNVSYITAGSPELPTLLLLHGFPASAAQYTTLIPHLSSSYHIVAPTFPGFGATVAPADYAYTFASLALTLSVFLKALNISRFAAYIFDYGAPVALRLAVAQATGNGITPGNSIGNSTGNIGNSTGSTGNATRPFDIAALISQNGNAYTVGFGQEAWAPIEQYWASGSEADRENVRNLVMTHETVESQYRTGVPQFKQDRIAPADYDLDYLQNVANSSGRQDIQLDLFYDYRNNVAMYPQFQDWFRETQVPLLAVWGKGDPSFVPAGAEAFKQDLPKAKVTFLDTGHFAVATDAEVIAEEIKVFLASINY